MTAEPKYLSGFVTIIGSPNVGKSTLMNRFVGQKVSIVSQRAQTTRNRIMGVVSRKGYQMVFLDSWRQPSKHALWKALSIFRRTWSLISRSV